MTTLKNIREYQRIYLLRIYSQTIHELFANRELFAEHCCEVTSFSSLKLHFKVTRFPAIEPHSEVTSFTELEPHCEVTIFTAIEPHWEVTSFTSI